MEMQQQGSGADGQAQTQCTACTHQHIARMVSIHLKPGGEVRVHPKRHLGCTLNRRTSSAWAMPLLVTTGAGMWVLASTTPAQCDAANLSASTTIPPPGTIYRTLCSCAHVHACFLTAHHRHPQQTSSQAWYSEHSWPLVCCPVIHVSLCHYLQVHTHTCVFVCTFLCILLHPPDTPHPPATPQHPCYTTTPLLRHNTPADKLQCHQLHDRFGRVTQEGVHKPVVLVSCGSFNPPTCMHLRMFELAANQLAKVCMVEVYMVEVYMGEVYLFVSQHRGEKHAHLHHFASDTYMSL